MENQRVVAFLNRQEVDFLDKLGKDAFFSSGTKLSRSKIIAWIVDFLKKLEIDGENIKSEQEFENRIFQVLTKDTRYSASTSHGYLLPQGSRQEKD